MKKLLILSLFSVCSIIVYSQNTIKGIIKDYDTKETLPGVLIKLDTIKKVAKTDLDGKFSFENIPNGQYTLTYKYPMYELKNDTLTITNQDVQLEINLEKKAIQGKLIIIKGNDPNKGSTDKRMLMERKNAVTVTDGVSAQSMKKTGDSDVSGAAKRITGVTIQNGKYIYVRGLGDRYTQTTLNGLVIPGLDPDVNAIPLDIFPTSIIDNLNVNKTVSPEFTGDYTGGLVNIATKRYPSKKTTEIGFGMDYNPNMHFRDDFLTYTKSKTDMLGFDDGQRQIPQLNGVNITNYVDIKSIGSKLKYPELANSITKSFNKELGIKKQQSMPNGSFSFNTGNKYTKKENLKIGYFTSLNYSNENILYENYESNDFMKDKNMVNLDHFYSIKGDIAKKSVLWNILSSGSINFKENNIDLTILHIQNGETTTIERNSEDKIANPIKLYENILGYSSKRLSSILLNGNHQIKKLSINWGNSFSLSNNYEPDYRESKFEITDNDTILGGNGSGIKRFWRKLDEKTMSNKLDFNYKLFENLNLKFGINSTFKNREFSVYTYKHEAQVIQSSTDKFDPNWYYQDKQIWKKNENENGFVTYGNKEPANAFNSSQSNLGSYIQINQSIKEKINISYGFRIEKFDMYYTGQNYDNSLKIDNLKTMNEINFLPSLNLNYKLNNKMNFRLAAGKSVARPSFKEISLAQIYDPITKRTFNGNLDLKQTNINNFDGRYEFYISDLELFAISTFYKRFDGHIEMVPYLTNPSNIKPRNSGIANLLGTEIEFKKTLGKKENKILNRFTINLNASFVKSSVDITKVFVLDDNGKESTKSEYELRNSNKKENEPEISKNRPMSGQSPYSLNASIGYEIPESETNISLSYNIQGPQLTIIASGLNPDVYTDPFNSLNLNAFRKFGKNQKSKITLTINNILQDRIALIYKSYGSKDEIYSSYNPGIQFSLKYNYTF